MTGASELERYLGELQTEGALQSRGQFTLDFARALEKLGGLARQEKHRWVFFVVQAAVGYGAENVRLSMSQRSLSASFVLTDPPAGLLDGHSFQSVEEKPDLRGEEAAAQNLRQALLWGRALNGSSFAMVVEGAHPGYMLAAVETGMQLRPLPAKSEGPTTCTLLLTPDARSSVHNGQWTSSFQAEAVYRLSLAPVPVHLDGLALSLGDSSSLLRNAGHRQGNVKLWERYIFGDPAEIPQLAALHPQLQPSAGYWIEGRPPQLRDRSWLPVPSAWWLEFAGADVADAPWEVLPAERTGRGICVARWDRGKGDQQGLWLGVDPGLELPRFDHRRVAIRALLTRMRVQGSYLILARHGMLLNPIRLQGVLGEGWVAVVASNSVRTDATGLTAVSDERMEQLQMWVRAEVGAIHEQMGGYRPVVR